MPKRTKASASPLRALTEQLAQEEAQLREGGGTAGLARQRKLGRLPARERIELLLDPVKRENRRFPHFLEIGLWSAYGMYADVGGAVSGGVTTGIGNVRSRPCMIVANDASIKAGSFSPATVKKVLRS